MKDNHRRYGFIKMSVSLFLLALSLYFTLYSATKATAEDLSYIDTLIRSAFQKGLYKDKQWLALLHYKKSIFGIRSLIDDPKFFLAKDGKCNPKSELEATIRSFFEARDSHEHMTSHPTCRFIARYTWLKEVLNFDDSKLPVPACTVFDDMIKKIKPESAAIIFPTSHMNRPASLFGHTLIIIETKNKSRLLSHAVNYAALTDASSGIPYFFKGLFGFYKGYFSALPYYSKVEEYSDFDQRDMWEYKLNLSRDEVVRMMMHAYELQNIYSYYYFFDENCSYNLLFLLDAVRPSLNLTDNNDIFITPLDTVRGVMRSGLIKDICYRPSKATKIKYISSLLAEEDQDLARAIAGGRVEPDIILDQGNRLEKKNEICDLAIEYIQYKYSKEEISKKRYVNLFYKTIQVRSKLEKADEHEYKIPVPTEPLGGHKTSRISIGGGIRNKELFQEIRYRPVYHDLLDPDDGYRIGSKLQCNVAFRYYYDDKKFQLESLDFWDLFSISPRDKFFNPISWKLKAGLIQKEMRNEDEHLVLQLNLGGGLAYENRFIGIYYAMIEPDLIFGPGLEHNTAIGIGGTLGLLCNITNFWKIHLFARDIFYALGDEHNELEITLCQNFRVSINNSIRLEISRRMTVDDYYTEGRLYWNFFF